MVATVEEALTPFDDWLTSTVEPLIVRTDAIIAMEKFGATDEEIKLFFRRV